MKTQFLFPSFMRPVGWVLLVVGLLIGIFVRIMEYDTEGLLNLDVFAVVNKSLFKGGEYFVWIRNGVLDETLVVFLLLGGLFTGFSKVRDEDEYVKTLRLESLAWSFYLNIGLLLVATLWVYGMAYFDVIIFNLFSGMLFFVFRFHYLLYKSRKALDHEK